MTTSDAFTNAVIVGRAIRYSSKSASTLDNCEVNCEEGIVTFERGDGSRCDAPVSSASTTEAAIDEARAKYPLNSIAQV